jgi:predicted anti-sigma-YlaC factor YlaD
VETYIDLISLATEYQMAVSTEEPDGFTPEDERRAFAVTQHTEELMHAVRWLGGQRS